jgi:menaquinone-9 beta-reductase
VSDEQREVVVVGGGPAGVATALLLRRRGHDVLLVDKARFPRDKVCGESVSPEAWRLLGELGLAAAVRELAPWPVRGMRLTAPDGTCFAGLYPEDRPAGFAVRRLRLDETLLAGARQARVEVREAAAVTGLLTRGREVRGVELASGRVIEARLVVGADGRGSLVARALGVFRLHPRLRKFALRAHVSGMQGLTELGEMHVARGAYCGVAPLGPPRANVAFVLEASALAGCGDLEAFFWRSLRRWPALVERLQGASIERPRAVGPLAVEALRLSAPGALLVGDAAGFYDPFTGEGVTLALRSAELAAEVAHTALAASGPPELAEYERLRRAATRDKFRLNVLLQRLIGWPELANHVARRLARRPALANRLVGIAGDFVPARSALGAGFLWELMRA